MRPLSFKTQILIAFVMIAMSYISLTQSPVQAQWPVTTNIEPTWSLEAGARFFDRPGDDPGVGLAFDSVTNEALFTSKHATELNGAPGVDLKLNFRGHRFGDSWEFRTLLVNFDSYAGASGDDMNFPLIPGISPEEIDYQYESRVLSLELNKRHSVLPGLILLGGTRFISIDEDAQLDFTDNIDTIFGPFTLTGGQAIEARNSMYGVQGGFEFNLPITQTLYVSTTGMLGGYYNPTRVLTTTFDSINGATSLKRSRSTGTFVAETGGRLNFEIIPSCLTAYVGYNAMWIDGIALAPAQFLGGTAMGEVDTANTLFMQSLLLGAQLQY